MTFHLIRPAALLLLVPLIYLGTVLYRKNKPLHAWSLVCDAHLLPYLLHNNALTPQTKKGHALRLVIAGLMILALSGPSMFHLFVPHYEPIRPQIILLDLSENMLKTDLKPTRLSRAKFKLHDLFKQKNTGLMGLIAYTEEPFVASPLTHDTKTIASLLDDLKPDIMPIDGSNLQAALVEAATLIKQSGSSTGDILVLTGEAPTTRDIDYAKKLARQGLHLSILPLRQSGLQSESFEAFSAQGQGDALSFTDDSSDIKHWLNRAKHQETYRASLNNSLSLWRDDGRLLLIPTSLLFLMLFRRHHPRRSKP